MRVPVDAETILAASVLNLCEAGGAVSAKSAAWQPARVDGDHPGDAVEMAHAVWQRGGQILGCP
ncbi:MAG TPA: hypothetical protein VEI45_14255 [Mycobacterium sp.]|uniref:hypothetical protein n=1 Tax=Mycobacterium sp. TaxID=1785 RepID=UPI002D27285E|nr:hypothetical protein [Mycobacterium sp.]HXY65475.1 hypothetical protein [Mycobacterium sp.]